MVLFSTIFAFLIFCCSVASAGDTSQDASLTRMLFYNQHFSRTPNLDFSFRLYNSNAELVSKSNLKLNNMGFFSSYDYSYVKKPHEYRILVIGSEQSASTVAEKCWPDHLQNILQSRFPNKLISVINIAWPDTRFPLYLDVYKKYGKPFNQDLILVNIVETDYGIVDAAYSTYTYKGKAFELRRVDYSLGPNPDDTAHTFIACLLDVTAPSISNPDCLPSRPYGFFASKRFFDDTDKVRKLQELVREDFLRGGVDRTFDPVITPEKISDEKVVEFASGVLTQLKAVSPDILFLHNFNYPEIIDKMLFPYTEKLMKHSPDLKVIDMRTYVEPTNRDVIKSWYLPDMQEKWSNEGHQYYASLVAKVVAKFFDEKHAQ